MTPKNERSATAIVMVLVTAVILAVIFAAMAKAAEPERIEDLQAKRPALVIERTGDKMQALRINDEAGQPVAIIHSDGTVEVLRGEPSEAARLFWEALSGYVKNCQAKTAK